MTEIEKLKEILHKEILHDDLFDSKDWRFDNGLIERVEWLISSYKSKKEELELFLDMSNKEIKRLKAELESEKLLSSCVFLIKEALEKCGIDVSEIPPMSYSDIIFTKLKAKSKPLKLSYTWKEFCKDHAGGEE